MTSLAAESAPPTPADLLATPPVLPGITTDTVVFSPHPGVDLTDVYSFLDRHTGD